MKFWGVQNDTFEENSHENEKIGVILGCALLPVQNTGAQVAF